MSRLLDIATDARQTPQWAKFMEGIGWEAHTINNVQIYVRNIKLFNHSLIKIQHARGHMPLKEIDELARKQKTIFVVIEPGPIGCDEEDFKKNGYIKSNLKAAYSANILVDINKQDEEIYASFSENARRNIRKAEKNKLRIETINIENETDETNIKKFYELHSFVSKKKNFYIHPYNEILAKMEAFKKNSFIIFAYEDNSTTPIGCIWFGYVNKTLYYINTGMTNRGYDLLANYQLLWEGIKTGKLHGCEVLDFEGIYDSRIRGENKKWKGFSEFKKRFHGETVYYPSPWIKIYNIPYKILYLCMSPFFHS